MCPLLLIWIWVEWFANCEVIADGYVRCPVIHLSPKHGPVGPVWLRWCML